MQAKPRNSWFNLEKLLRPRNNRNRQKNHSFDYRNLEPRQLLSANAPASLSFLVNDEVVAVEHGSELQLQQGDEFKVVEINFDSETNAGVFAAEGYINKIRDDFSASVVDYDDGRFSLRSSNPNANLGSVTIPGLHDSWVAEDGWDRLTISVMNYSEEGATQAEQIAVSIRVGEPDLQFNLSAVESFNGSEFDLDSEVEIPVHWLNSGTGLFHNYAEVDIYHASNTDEIVWAGASVGNVGNGHEIEDMVRNTRDGDGFSELWTPDQEGEYILKYYLDPESAVTETDESNNEFEVRVNVKSNTIPVGVDDFFESTSGETITAFELSFRPVTLSASGVPSSSSSDGRVVCVGSSCSGALLRLLLTTGVNDSLPSSSKGWTISSSS